ncbi:MAG: nuclear transport factor 2 family protein [Pseudomonadota bacterium]
MFDEKLTETAMKLVGYCREGKEYQGLDELYHKDAVSVEAADLGGGNVVTEGADNIRAKHDWWNNAMEVHSVAVEGPYIHGDTQFSAIFELDATDKQSGARQQMKEVAIYTVDDGKIVREEFFYKAFE